MLTEGSVHGPDGRETLIASVGRLVSSAATFGSFMLLARMLGADEYARLGLITGLLSFLQMILVAPAVAYAQREVWFWFGKGHLPSRTGYLAFGTTLLFAGSSGLLVAGARVLGWIASESLGGVAAGMALAALLNILTVVFMVAGVLRDRVSYAASVVLDSVSRLVFAVVLALAGVRTAWVYFCGMQAVGLVGTAVAYALRRRNLLRVGLTLRGLGEAIRVCDVGQVAVALSGSVALRLATLFSWMLTTGSRYVLERLVARESLGAFLAAWGLGLALLSAVEGLFTAVMGPVLFQNTSGANDTPERRRTENSLYLAMLAAVILPLTAGLVGAADHVAPLVLGKGTAITVPVLRAGMVYAALHILLSLMGNVALVERKPPRFAVAMAAAFGLGTVALVLLTTRLGIVEGAWGLTFGSLAGLSVAVSLLRRAISAHPLVRLGGSVALATALSGALSFAISGMWQAQGLVPWLCVIAWGIVGSAWLAWLWFDVRRRAERLRSESSIDVAIVDTATSRLG